MGFTYKYKLQPFWATIFGISRLAHSIDDTKLNFLYLTMVFRKAESMVLKSQKGGFQVTTHLSYIG